MNKQINHLRLAMVAGSLIGITFSAAPASAQQSIVDAVKQGCAKELQTYCKDVTAGEGRIASCLYAYEDKLSLGCAVAVYNGVLDLERANVSLRIYAKQCSSDLMQYCSTVEPGGGRLYGCIMKNKATLTKECSGAVKKAEPTMRKLGLVK
jgi:Golgi apparatus protein 1